MSVSSACQSKEARPPLPFFEVHSYIFATGGLGNGMYSQTVYDFISSIFYACQGVLNVCLPTCKSLTYKRIQDKAILTVVIIVIITCPSYFIKRIYIRY